MRLQARIAVVTGGSSGIGRGIGLELAREGAKVVVADMQEAPKIGKFHETEPRLPTAEVIAGEGGEALFVETDVTDEKAVENLIARSAERFGGVDILVNNAGITIQGDSQELSVEAWDRVVGANLRSIFLTTKFAAPYLRKSAAGRIVNIASVHAFGGGPAYAPTNARFGVGTSRGQRRSQRGVPRLYRDADPRLFDPGAHRAMPAGYALAAIGIDLAEMVGAALGVMDRDAKKMRGEGPTVFACIKDKVGL